MIDQNIIKGDITMKKMLLTLSLSALLVPFAAAEVMTVDMNIITADGVGEKIGTVDLQETEYGVVLTPNLKGLTPGVHGFHVHANPNCGNVGADGTKGAGLAAGGHFDPTDAKKHGAPWGDGHLGDLPPLHVTEDGTATTAVLAPRIKSVADVKDRSIMVHVHGDNFSDDPAPLGGGGARMACGVIPK